MIPKKIHYCWLGDDAIPPVVQDFMSSWKIHMPDYEYKRWDKSNFDIGSITFVKEAVSVNKMAFASDYIRLFALYIEGGIYLDTDVVVCRKFDDFLDKDFFSSLEYHADYVKEQHTLRLLHPDGSSKKPFTRKPGIGIQAAVMGSIKGHPFLRKCLNFYENQHFILSKKRLFDTIIAPDIFAMHAEKYGFRYKDEKQELTHNMLILPSEFFAGGPQEATENSYAIHYSLGSWRDKPKEPVIRRIKKRLKNNPAVRFLFGKKPLKTTN